jgi:arylsulfatase
MLGSFALSFIFVFLSGDLIAQKKPNILVIMGDFIGWFNPSYYNRGMMGFRTPDIDRIASEGALFNTWYGQQSCTAGRPAFIITDQENRTTIVQIRTVRTGPGFICD